MGALNPEFNPYLYSRTSSALDCKSIAQPGELASTWNVRKSPFFLLSPTHYHVAGAWLECWDRSVNKKTAAFLKKLQQELLTT